LVAGADFWCIFAAFVSFLAMVILLGSLKLEISLLCASGARYYGIFAIFTIDTHNKQVNIVLVIALIIDCRKW
jgi:hypothetical protein